jgi:hypothetical protein
MLLYAFMVASSCVYWLVVGLRNSLRGLFVADDIPARCTETRPGDLHHDTAAQGLNGFTV